MPRTIKTQVYQFSELSDSAQERARNWYRSNGLDYEWWDSVYETAKTAGALMGIDIEDIYFSGFSSQGDGACFTGRYAYRKGWRKALRAEFGDDLLKALEELGQELQNAQAPCFYRLESMISTQGRYSHSHTMRAETSDRDEPYRDIGDAEEDICDALRSFADWIYRQLEAEHDWLNADEQVDETIAVNGYEFTATGGPA